METVDFQIGIQKVFFRENKVFFSLKDGREIGILLSWYPKLEKASEKELLDYTISPGGYGVHWNLIDEDLSAYGMLQTNQQQTEKLL